MLTPMTEDQRIIDADQHVMNGDIGEDGGCTKVVMWILESCYSHFSMSEKQYHIVL